MTKIDLPCSVITDLLPLYQDGLCSPESKELVEAHLQICKDCQALSDDLPLPETKPDADPGETEAFRRVRKKTRRGKLLRIMSICASVLIIGFLVLNAVWFPAKYFPYKALCRGFSESANIGAGTQYTKESGEYLLTVKMPGYLSFEGGFLAVEPVSAPAAFDESTSPEAFSGAYPKRLFIWPAIGGEPEFGIMILKEQTQNWGTFSQFYINSDLEYLDEKNTLPTDPPERTQESHALYEANLDAVRGMMDAAKAQWKDLFE